jgi:hypothetical protein
MEGVNYRTLYMSKGIFGYEASCWVLFWLCWYEHILTPPRISIAINPSVEKYPNTYDMAKDITQAFWDKQTRINYLWRKAIKPPLFFSFCQFMSCYVLSAVAFNVVVMVVKSKSSWETCQTDWKGFLNIIIMDIIMRRKEMEFFMNAWRLLNVVYKLMRLNAGDQGKKTGTVWRNGSSYGQRGLLEGDIKYV